MSKESTIGPLLACAIGDAFGAGFEFAPVGFVRQHNDLSGYIQHPKWKTKPGSYTDDTQMTMAICEHMLGDLDWTPLRLANTFVECFHRDQRTGYARGFYKFLLATKTGLAFLKDIRPHSDKSGGAMRAFPIGFLEDTNRVVDLAMFQASLTHATRHGMVAAAAAALMFHHRYHRLGPKADLPMYLDRHLPGFDFDVSWKGKVGAPGLECVWAALTALVENDTLDDVLKACVAWTGDVDTVAAIAMPSAAVCEDTSGELPDVLHEGLEKGDYGYDHICDLDAKLLAKFPRASDREAELEAAREAKRAAKTEIEEVVPPSGPLDFLFDD